MRCSAYSTVHTVVSSHSLVGPALSPGGFELVSDPCHEAGLAGTAVALQCDGHARVALLKSRRSATRVDLSAPPAWRDTPSVFRDEYKAGYPAVTGLDI